MGGAKGAGGHRVGEPIRSDEGATKMGASIKKIATIRRVMVFGLL